MGPEGSGKGTQAALLAQELQMPHIISGDILRARHDEDSPLGEHIRQVMSSGQYLSDQEITAVILHRLEQSDCIYGFILDGYPRSINQVHSLDEFLKKKNEKIDFAFNLLVSHDESVRRLLERKRFDDTPENIEKRLALYAQRSVDMLAFYKHGGVLFMIDGEKTITEVHKEIKHVVQDFI